jgi:voltage-gated potassium channel
VILQLACAALLLCVCVVVHALGTVAITRVVRHHHRDPDVRALHRPVLGLVIGLLFVFLLHVAEVGLWAAAYRSLGAFLDFEEALYFSMTSFTTAGYGDLMPPVRWRILGAEVMAGMVLLGWSAGLVLVLLERMNRRALEED